jgi:hypothetical protein
MITMFFNLSMQAWIASGHQRNEIIHFASFKNGTVACLTRRALVANGVSKVMVPGRGHPTMRSRQMVVQFGRGPVTYPTGQPSES